MATAMSTTNHKACGFSNNLLSSSHFPFPFFYPTVLPGWRGCFIRSLLDLEGDMSKLFP